MALDFSHCWPTIWSITHTPLVAGDLSRIRWLPMKNNVITPLVSLSVLMNYLATTKYIVNHFAWWWQMDGIILFCAQRKTACIYYIKSLQLWLSILIQGSIIVICIYWILTTWDVRAYHTNVYLFNCESVTLKHISNMKCQYTDSTITLGKRNWNKNLWSWLMQVSRSL